MSEKRYKLHLTLKQLDFLKGIFDGYDWLCDCKDFPNCDDFKMFQKLKKRISKLDVHSESSQFAGHESHRKMKNKYIQEGANIQRGL